MNSIVYVLCWALGILGAVGLCLLWSRAKETKDKSVKWIVYGIIILILLIAIITGS